MKLVLIMSNESVGYESRSAVNDCQGHSGCCVSRPAVLIYANHMTLPMWSVHAVK
jgi:hypothetical protein